MFYIKFRRSLFFSSVLLEMELQGFQKIIWDLLIASFLLFPQVFRLSIELFLLLNPRTSGDLAL